MDPTTFSREDTVNESIWVKPVIHWYVKYDIFCVPLHTHPIAVANP